METDRNKNSVLCQLAALQKMSLCDLQEKWNDLYGCEAPHFKSTFLKKRLAYRIQELFYGGISEELKKKLTEISSEDPLLKLCIENEKKQTRKKVGSDAFADEKILPGTRFIREWNGANYEVVAREKCYEYDGRNFRSLSAVATEITGTRWNGKLFFGLIKRKKSASVNE